MEFFKDEIITFLISLGVLVFILANRAKLSRTPSWPILFGAYSAFLAGLLFGIVEGMFWPSSFNALEHLGYTLSGILMAVWAWRIFGPRKRHE